MHSKINRSRVVLGEVTKRKCLAAEISVVAKYLACSFKRNLKHDFEFFIGRISILVGLLVNLFFS